MTFLQQSSGDCSMVEKTVLVTTSYEGCNDEEELKMAPVVNQNNSKNIVSDSSSESNEEDAGENIFDDNIDAQVTATPKTTINAKVVHAIRTVRASSKGNTKKKLSKLKKQVPLKI